jgi:hypothetical protein
MNFCGVVKSFFDFFRPFIFVYRTRVTFCAEAEKIFSRTAKTSLCPVYLDEEDNMPETLNPNIVSALQRLTAEELDRVRLKLWKRFGEQLRNIPNAPDPEELLHETIEDLLTDRRRCPLERVALTICLMNIVRSKVSHLYEKWKSDGIVKVSDEILDFVSAPEVHESELREKILACMADDPVLTKIVEYRLDHTEQEPIKAQDMAEVLGMEIHEIYNANRRLKVRLKSLVSL